MFLVVLVCKQEQQNCCHTTRYICIEIVSNGRSISFKDTRMGKNTLKQNSSAFRKYEYGHLGSWYFKPTLYSRLLKQNFRKKKK